MCIKSLPKCKVYCLILKKCSENRAVNLKEFLCHFRISPGNVWTPMWENGAKMSPNEEAMIKGGRDAQV